MEHTTGPKEEDRRPLRPDTPIELTLYLRAEELVNMPGMEDFIARVSKKIVSEIIKTLRERGQWPDTTPDMVTGEAGR